jgi:hypothetical protein
MKCDFCHEEMDTNETGIFLLEEKMGGHILCAMKAQKKIEEKEQDK